MRTSRRWTVAWGALALVLAGACSDDGSGAPLDAAPLVDAPADAGGADGGGSDPGAGDPGAPDPGPDDAGAPDPGPSDPGALDPGGADPGQTDAGAPDAGAADPGPADVGPGDPGLEPDPGPDGDAGADGGPADAGGDVIASPCGVAGCGTLDATAVAGVGAVVPLTCHAESGQCYEPGGLCKPDVAGCALGSACGYDVLLGLGVCTCNPSDTSPACYPGQSCGLGPLTGVFGVAYCYLP